LSPSFGVTLAEIKSKIKGKVKISKNSTFVIKGDVTLGNIEVDGVFICECGNGHIDNIKINDKKYHKFVEINPNDKNLT
jgi:hypothetical protein